ncbi:unnamed protein product, partial [marine sediment metagenome]
GKGGIKAITVRIPHPALKIADRACGLENGQVVLESDSKGLLQDDYIKRAYRGL